MIKYSARKMSSYLNEMLAGTVKIISNEDISNLYFLKML